MSKLLIIIFFISSCSVDFVKNEFRIFNKYKETNNYTQALLSLNKIINKTTDVEIKNKALLEKADIYLNKMNNNGQLIKTYKQLLKISDNDHLRVEYSILLADIYINKLHKYDEPIFIINNTISMVDKNNAYFLHKKLSEMYFKKKDYFQAELELSKYLKSKKLTKNEIFSAKTIQADIYFHKKEISSALKIYESLLKNHPHKSKVNDIHMSLLSLYESEGEYKKAIILLKQMLSKYPKKNKFLKSKLSRFNDNVKNMPGAKGLRR